MNDAFEKITGWAREEAIGRTTVELGIWRDQETRNEAIARLQRDAYVREYPIQLGTRDGRWIDGVLNASIIEASGQRYLLGVVRDISKQKAAEAALRESEEKFSRIVQYSPVALVITDVETGVVLDFNRAWQELLGYSQEQAIGHLSADFGLGSTTPTATRSTVRSPPATASSTVRGPLPLRRWRSSTARFPDGFSPLVAVPAICGRSPTSPCAMKWRKEWRS